MKSFFYQQGYNNFTPNFNSKNPYAINSPEGQDWQNGFNAAEEDFEKEVNLRNWHALHQFNYC